MLIRIRLSLLALLWCCLPSLAQAHYLWVVVNPKPGDHGTANLYFEEGPGPGDGQYLDPFVSRGKTWIRTVDQPKPQALKMKTATKDKNRWLAGALSAAGPRSIDSYGKWGVYRYGKTDVLLHYYARNLEVTTHDDLHELGRAEQQMLDLVPHDDQDEVNVRLLWQGKGVKGRQVFVRGPKGFRQTLKTDNFGRITFKPESPGRYTMRSSVEEPDKGGEFEGKTYSKVRHNVTLVMKLPLEQ